jgi:hypothetical protein
MLACIPWKAWEISADIWPISFATRYRTAEPASRQTTHDGEDIFPRSTFPPAADKMEPVEPHCRTLME